MLPLRLNFFKPLTYSGGKIMKNIILLLLLLLAPVAAFPQEPAELTIEDGD
jgi:hypothetical protein